MARTKHESNGDWKEAMQQNMLAMQQGQAAMQQSIVATQQTIAFLNPQKTGFLAEIAEMKKDMADMRRYMEQRFVNIEAILIEQKRILQALPDAVRDKIGFNPKAPA